MSLEGSPYGEKFQTDWKIDLSYPIYIVEVPVMKLPTKVEFNPDPVLCAGWELVLFTNTQKISIKKSSQSQLWF